MPARLNGRANISNSSTPGIKEDTIHLGNDLFFCPFRMMTAHAGFFQFSGHPIKLLSNLQSPLTRHGAQNLDVLRTKLFVGQHGNNMRCSAQPSKLFALAKASPSFDASLPPPRALSGLPPPLPPTIGAMP